MLRFYRSAGSRYCDGVTRREVLRMRGALGWGGLALPGLLRLSEAAESQPGSRLAHRARSVVILYLSGGPSQLDMWDMKPAAPEEIRGTFQPVMTSVPGIHVCEHMPRMARLADKYTIVRSMSHHEGDHLRAGYCAMTGGSLQRRVVQASGMSRDDRPHVGSAMAKFLETPSALPPFVMIPEFISPVGVPRPGQHAGFLGSEFDPYLVNSDPNLPSYSPGELAPASDLSLARMSNRRRLLASLEERPVAGGDPRWAKPRSVLFQGIRSDLLAGCAVRFDISSEPESTRDRYGRTDFGQSTLVARRLIEAGVRLVQVNFVRHDRGKGGQGYDSHSTPPRPAHLTWAKTALLASDRFRLQRPDRGLERSQFTRRDAGDHDGRVRPHAPFQSVRRPRPLAAMLQRRAGRRRRPRWIFFGTSDQSAATVVRDPVSPEDLLATVYRLVGIDPRRTIHDLQRRPFPLVSGKPVEGMLA